MMRNLDAMLRSGELQRMAAANPVPAEPQEGPTVSEPLSLVYRDLPLINWVPAGKPGAYTDLGYPKGGADEFIRVPTFDDPDAFAARITGDSMEPDYREGDVIIFSPARKFVNGADCFVRFDDTEEVAFKRVFMERDDDGREFLRLQPLNLHYRAKRVPREAVSLICPAHRLLREF